MRVPGAVCNHLKSDGPCVFHRLRHPVFSTDPGTPIAAPPTPGTPAIPRMQRDADRSLIVFQIIRDPSRSCDDSSESNLQLQVILN